MAHSSTEAKYHVIASTTIKVNWIRNILAELHVPLIMKPTMSCDNVSATHLRANPVFHFLMKHIAVDFHFVQDQVVKKLLQTSHVHTMIVNSLKKSIPWKQFEDHHSKNGILNRYPILRVHDMNQSTLHPRY